MKDCYIMEDIGMRHPYQQLKNVMRAGKTRQTTAKKCRL